MYATTRINSTNNFSKNHIEPNFGNAKSSSNSTNITYTRIPTIATTTTTTQLYSNISSSNNPLLLQATSNGTASCLQRQRATQAESVTSRECSNVAYSALTTMRVVGKELGAAGDGEEARTKLMPAAAIKIISVNNSKNSNNNSNAPQNVSNSVNNTDNNINKSTSKSTATTGAKLDSSMLINSRNQMSTTTTTHEQRQQQTEHMLSITRDLNQINLKSSLYNEQQTYNANNNNMKHKHNCRGNNQQQQHDVQNSLNTKARSDTNNSSNNKHSNAGNNNKQKQQQQITNGSNNSSKDCDQANDNNSKNTHTLMHEMTKMKNNDNNKGSNELEQQLQQQQQQLITLTMEKTVQSKTTTLVSENISTTTKVSAEKYAVTTTTPTIERAKANTAKLTLRKSFSTPASFKIADVAAAMSQCGNMIGNNNNNRPDESYSKSLSKALSKSAAVAETPSSKKSDSDGGDDDGGCNNDGGGGHIHGAATCTKPTATSAATAAKVNFALLPAIITNAAQLTNTSIEAITTPAATTATTTVKTITTTISQQLQQQPKLATMNVVTHSKTAAHASEQQESQQQQQQQQQSSTKSVKGKDNDNQVICGNKNISDDGNVVVASTTNTSSMLPLSPVNFDFDLRFGCAHYKRRAMFVTPCCNKFYKCRFCHDENESHHFDRKTLTELICSECNTRQKVQEQCEACGTRFGKYICLICNLFDDTDKKQYHCNGCGICRIGGAENFFHCKVCDMCLPIRLKIDGHRCVENISRSHCPVCLGDIHTSRIPCHIPDCGHLLHKTCFDQLLNSGHYTCPICQTSLIDMTALWEYLDAQAVSLPVPKKYENQRIHIFCNDCHKTSKTKFNFIGLKCTQCGAYNTTQDVKRRMSLVTDEPSSA